PTEVLDAGGSSTPLLTDEHLDVRWTTRASARGVHAGHQSVGDLRRDHLCGPCGAALDRVLQHESCGKCTPCREGTFWLDKIYARLETGKGTREDIDKLLDISDSILGKSFCALGDGAASPVMSSIKHFQNEYIGPRRTGRLPLRSPGLRCSQQARNTAERDWATDDKCRQYQDRRRGEPAGAGDADYRRVPKSAFPKELWFIRAASSWVYRSHGSVITRCSSRSARVGNAWSRWKGQRKRWRRGTTVAPTTCVVRTQLTSEAPTGHSTGVMECC
ncbi:NADH-ubiquinone oxidoreductase-F iron-sulfur binding region family protein, partial [Mycobacterium ulcerans str. Harvey]